MMFFAFSFMMVLAASASVHTVNVVQVRYILKSRSAHTMARHSSSHTL